MATVLFAWELGGGLGHLMQMLPLAWGLRREHRVVAVLRHLSPAAAEALCPLRAQVLQAPHKSPGDGKGVRSRSFAGRFRGPRCSG
jgi:hypothetical protein